MMDCDPSDTNGTMGGLNPPYDPVVLDGKSPAELHARRQEIIVFIAGLPRQHDDAPTILLQELAYITGALRRKTAGPPKTAKASKRTVEPKLDTDVLAGLLDG